MSFNLNTLAKHPIYFGIFSSIKQKLRTGELSASSDKWPIFLYASYKYDEANPWKGFLKSAILVKVYQYIILLIDMMAEWIVYRPSSIYSHLQVQLKQKMFSVII